MYFFIVNPNASSGKGLKLWGSVARELVQQKVAYQVFFTEYHGHATELSRKLSTEHAPCTIIAMGGDGTANEVVDGLRNYTGIRFGYIPTGSGNDLARGLKLPADPKEALGAILNPKRLLQLNVGESRFDGRTRRFIVSSGIGFDAAVCHFVERSKIKGFLNLFRLGKLSYLGIALKQIALLRPFSLELTLEDGTLRKFPRVFFSAFMNLRYEGGGFMFCPDADAQDDLLDICLVEALPKWKIPLILPTAFQGKHVRYQGIHTMRCKKALVKTNAPQAIHTDGETHGFHSELALTLSPEKLPFIAG